MANKAKLERKGSCDLGKHSLTGILDYRPPYSQPNLFERVRDLAMAAFTEESVAGVQKREISVLKIQQSLEIKSIIQEARRLRTMDTGPRFVRQDVVLQEQYLLKRGSTVIIPNRAIRFDEEIWGTSVEKFDEKRFRKSPSKPKVPYVAYGGFGGGAAICPSKYSPTEGIAVIVALLVLKYDLRPL